jgi:serine/threonine protein kinase
MENQSTVASSWENFHDEQQYKEDEIDRVSSQTSHYCSVFTEKYLMGSGGFGQVFHAVNNFDGEDYAIKKILLTSIHHIFIYLA